MRSKLFVFPVAVFCLLVAHAPACFADFVVDLGPASSPTVNGSGHTIEQFTVTLNFDPTGTPYAGQKLAFFAIDVSLSSAALTNSGAFTAFSFAPGSSFPPG